MNKQEVRELMEGKRKATSYEERKQAALDIFQKASTFILEDDALFVFIAMGDEVDTSMFFDKYKNVSVPKCFKGGVMKAITGYSKLEKTSFGTMEPVDGIEIDDIDVAIIPGLAFSNTRDRIGYGAGYYDKFLKSHANIFKIGVCYDCQITDDFKGEDHDVKVDCILTEKRIITCDDQCE